MKINGISHDTTLFLELKKEDKMYFSIKNNGVPVFVLKETEVYVVGHPLTRVFS